MSKFKFTSGIDLGNIDLSQFTDGTIESFSATEATIRSGDYSATITGEDFGYNFFTDEATGTIHTFTASYQDVPLIIGTKMNVDLNQLYNDREDPAALIDDIFGGRDSFLGSSDNDVLYGFGGNDKIDGNKGADLLFGGAGRDTFVYDKESDSDHKNPDMIGDLDDSRDSISFAQLEGITLDDITASFDGSVGPNGVTTFSINTDDDARAEMKILADGDHTAFANFILDLVI